MSPTVQRSPPEAPSPRHSSAGALWVLRQGTQHPPGPPKALLRRIDSIAGLLPIPKLQ